MPNLLMDTINRAPKAELHVHLEGSITVDTLNLLAQKKGLTPFRQNPYRFSNFEQFDALFPRLGPYFDSEEDFYQIALAFAHRLVEEHITYCEVSIMPYVHVRRGISFNSLMEMVDSAFTRVEMKHRINVRLICAIPRALGREAGESTLDWVERWPNKRIVGIDLAGQEAPGTIRPFVPVFERAREMGLGTVSHAGEMMGPEAIWETVKKLRPSRIGHGISAVKDKELLHYLAGERIPLDISITSNLKLKAVSSLESHPVKYLYLTGIPITINTDDPAFFKTSLTKEYSILVEQFGFGEDEIKRIIKNGFKYRLGHLSPR